MGTYPWLLTVTVLQGLQAALACLSIRVAGNLTKSPLGGQGSGTAGAPAVLHGPGWCFPAGPLLPLRTRTHTRSGPGVPRRLLPPCLSLSACHPPLPSPLGSPSCGHCRTAFLKSLLMPGQINGTFESIPGPWKAKLTSSESMCCGCGWWGMVLLFITSVVPLSNCNSDSFWKM